MIHHLRARRRISSVFITLYLSATVLCNRADFTAASVDPEPTLGISSDGTCGNGVTCLGSNSGKCCSEHGYCGSSDAYCGIGCLPAFGECSEVVSVTEQPTCSPIVTTVTRTTRETLTIYKFSTEQAVATSTTTVTATSVLKTTSTAVVIETSISIIYKTNTATTVVTMLTTPVGPPFATATSSSSKLTSSSRPGGDPPYPSFPAPPSRTTSYTNPVSPPARQPSASPTLVGMVSECKRLYKIEETDSCNKVWRLFGITREQILAWNPALQMSSATATNVCKPQEISELQQGRCKMECNNLWPGYYICVSA